MHIHDVFHPNLLRLAAEDPPLGQYNNPLPPVVVNDKEKWEVDDILDAKKHGRRVHSESNGKAMTKISNGIH